MRLFAILEIINVLGTAQGLFLAFVLFQSARKGNKANYWLAALLIVFSITIVGSVLGSSGLYRKYPHLIRVGDVFVMLAPALLYNYIRSLLNRPFQYPRDLWVYIFFVAYAVLNIPFFLSSGEEKIAFIDQYFLGHSPDPIIIVISSLRIVITFLFTLLIHRMLKQTVRELSQSRSNAPLREITHLNRLVLYFFLFTASILLATLLVWMRWITFLEMNIIIATLLSIIVYTIGYFGLTQGDTFTFTVPIPPVGSEVLPVKDTTRLSSIAVKVQQLMQEKFLYRQSDLSIETLADEIGEPYYLVSQAINEQLGTSFFDLVNQYRVEEVKSKITDPGYGHLTILGLANDAGFNSKSSFNAAFKKYTGTTPSAFKKQHSQ